MEEQVQAIPEWIWYVITVVCGAWGTDKAWWHAKRIQNRRNGDSDPGPIAYPQKSNSVDAIERSVAHTKRAVEAIGDVAKMQSDLVALNGRILENIKDNEKKIDEVLLQTKLNAQAIQALERQH